MESFKIGLYPSLVIPRLIKRARTAGGVTSAFKPPALQHCSRFTVVTSVFARGTAAATLCLAAGCATTTSGKVYQNMVLGGAAGVAYGSSQSDYKGTQAALYGSLGAAIAAATTIYFEDPDKTEIKLRNEVNTLKAKLDHISEPKLVGSVPATFGARIPVKYRQLVQPGEWKVYETDTWVEESENRLIHQDKIMELIPPVLIPGGT
ncbi:hypothetical protein [Bdellovibrio svalbardensis]|uniref:hypothetical protein n=1 Tax=Bdellovibrio svalbardensis TaxID=2972972 RepID=UPI0024081A1A|nr:hypothetical protein [Bdellovibrio svalbardensis]